MRALLLALLLALVPAVRPAMAEACYVAMDDWRLATNVTLKPWIQRGERPEDPSLSVSIIHIECRFDLEPLAAGGDPVAAARAWFTEEMQLKLAQERRVFQRATLTHYPQRSSLGGRPVWLASLGIPHAPRFMYALTLLRPETGEALFGQCLMRRGHHGYPAWAETLLSSAHIAPIPDMKACDE